MKRAAGIFNVIFEEELGIKIWTITGSPVESLSQIEAQAKQIEAEPPVSSCHSCKSPSAEIIWPTPVDGIESGMFQINLVEVQQKNSSLNSQEILLPFLEGKKDFIELEIICMHVPKWLDRELETLNLELYTEDRKDEFCHVFLSRKSSIFCY
jgi:Fe-only nitrogenase accessory protein AnfO